MHLTLKSNTSNIRQTSSLFTSLLPINIMCVISSCTAIEKLLLSNQAAIDVKLTNLTNLVQQLIKKVNASPPPGQRGAASRRRPAVGI